MRSFSTRLAVVLATSVFVTLPLSTPAFGGPTPPVDAVVEGPTEVDTPDCERVCMEELDSATEKIVRRVRRVEDTYGRLSGLPGLMDRKLRADEQLRSDADEFGACLARVTERDGSCHAAYLADLVPLASVLAYSTPSRFAYAVEGYVGKAKIPDTDSLQVARVVIPFLRSLGVDSYYHFETYDLLDRSQQGDR